MRKLFILLHSTFLVALVATSSKKDGKKTSTKIDYLFGRIPPGRFEYPALNGYFRPKQAVKVCETDPACGGFTFKGTAKVPGLEFETYFFHFVPSEWFSSNLTIEQYFHWTSYRVKSRNFTVLKDYKLKAMADLDNGGCLDERPRWTTKEATLLSDDKEFAAALHTGSVGTKCQWEGHRTFDFATLEKVESGTSGIEIYINLNSDLTRIKQSFPPANRCCKLPHTMLKFDGIDEFERVPCDMDRDKFEAEYVYKRKPVILTGCTKDWPAKDWTIEQVLSKYEGNWSSQYQNYSMDKCDKSPHTSELLIRLFNDEAYSVKVFQQIYKHVRNLIHSEQDAYEQKLGLLDGYHHPEVLPKDMYEVLGIETNYAYLMLGTKRTGTWPHMDPSVTDAYNGLVLGHKWWVALPRDFYEFIDEWLCDPQCSDTNTTDNYKAEAWYHTIYPQLRGRMFYGDYMKSGLQSPHETIYMPHFIPHAVYNLDSTLALGDNLLFPSAIDELSRSIEPDQLNQVLWRLRGTPFGDRLEASVKQLTKASKAHGIDLTVSKFVYE